MTGTGAGENSGTPTTYQLQIRVAETVWVPVGALGTLKFPAGCYLYTGSARRNLEARLRRHLSSDKKLRWHIDYLLSAPGVSVETVLRSTLAECELNQQTKGEILVSGFGASDCRAGCGSHLKRVAG